MDRGRAARGEEREGGDSLSLPRSSPHRAYLLYWNGAATVIDFPQSVDPQANEAALELLERDIANLYAVFAGYDVVADPARIAHSLWARYRRDTLRPEPL